MIETALLVLVVVAGFWYAWRHRRAGAPPPLVDPAVADDDPMELVAQMPRMGKPGTATDRQIDDLVANRFDPAPPCRDLHDYSTEEAQAFLEALAYIRAAIVQCTGESEPAPSEIENELIVLVLAEAELRDGVQRWARAGCVLPLKPGATFSRVQQAVLRVWEPADKANPIG